MTTKDRDNKLVQDPVNAAELRLSRRAEGRDVVTGSLDDLLLASIALEVAVDDYSAASFAFETNKSERTASASVAAGNAVIRCATRVALAMVDADVEGTQFASIIPARLRDAAADDEIAALHGDQRLVPPTKCSRCAGTGQFITYIENGVPKGPGGPCYRCGGKGIQTTADRKRNYGYDNFAPIPMY